MTALRYVENNPVAAKMVRHAQDWPWSSARSHLAGKLSGENRLTDLAALAEHIPNWQALLKHGPGAAGLDAAGEAVLDAIEERLRTGRPLGAKEWIAMHEAQTKRRLAPAKRGPKPNVSEV